MNEVAALREERLVLIEKVANLEEEVAYLKSELGQSQSEERIARLREILKVQPQACRVLSALMSGRLMSKDQIIDVVSNFVADPQDSKVADVRVCQLRKVLRPMGIDITTVWGQGYRLTPENIAKINDLIGADQP